MTQIVRGVLIEWLPTEKDKQEDTEQNSENKKSPLIERVLFVHPAEDYAVVISTDEKVKDLPYPKPLSELKDAVEQGLAFRRLFDPHVWYANPADEFLEKHVHVRDRAWRCIKDIISVEPDIYINDLRGRLIREAAEKNKVERCEIYLFVRRWWKRGMILNALLPSYDKCGGIGKERKIEPEKSDTKDAKIPPKRGRPPRRALVDHEKKGINIDQVTKVLIVLGFKSFYNTNKKYPLRRAYDLTIQQFFNVGYREVNGVQVPIPAPAFERPTYGQFKYWTLMLRMKVETVIKRQTPKVFNLNCRATLGNSTLMAQGPGAIYQIDATIGDIFLVSSLNRIWIIGRPVIYIVIDVFSHMVVGIYVGLEGPSWAGAMMAIVNAASNKVGYYAEHGLLISYDEFPCDSLCDKWLADRGEMICKDSDKLTLSLDMSVANCPPFRGDFKGIVERNFGRINEKVIKWTPGEVRKRAPGDKDYRLDAKLTLHEFTKMLLIMVREYNHHHLLEDYPLGRDLIRDNVEPIPINLWNWGKVHRSGSLRERSPDIIRAALMPSGMARVTQSGIRFNGMHYTCARAEQERWFDQAGYGKSWPIPVSYDKRLNDVIYMRTTDGKSYEPCTLLEKDQRFKGTRLEEVEDYFAMQRIAADFHEDDRAQSEARIHAQKEHIVSQATEMTNAALAEANLSNRQRTSNINQYRAVEKELIRKNEAFRLGQKTQDVTEHCSPGSDPVGFQPSQEDHLAESLPNKKMALLEKLAKRSEGETS